MWISCAADSDGCVYFMPHNAKRIMKCVPPADLLCTVSNLYLFMFASNVSAIDHVLRHATSWVSASTNTASHTT